MFSRFHMFAFRLLAAAAFMVANGSAAQSTVVYHSGPVSLNPGPPSELDLNQDGVADYQFTVGTLAGLPSPGFPSTSTPYLETFAFNRNDYLMNSEGRIMLKQTGVMFGPQTVPGESWGHRDFEQQSIAYATGNTWPGFSGLPPEAFLGVRFLSDGVAYYGWIRFVAPDTNAAGIFPWISDWAYETRPNTPIVAGVGKDSDHDGVWDYLDQCPGTPPGSIVDTNGCSIAQLCPCDGPWKNHGDYVRAVNKIVQRFAKEGLITKHEERRILKQAAGSHCGKSKRKR